MGEGIFSDRYIGNTFISKYTRNSQRLSQFIKGAEKSSMDVLARIILDVLWNNTESIRNYFKIIWNSQETELVRSHPYCGGTRRIL